MGQPDGRVDRHRGHSSDVDRSVWAIYREVSERALGTMRVCRSERRKIWRALEQGRGANYMENWGTTGNKTTKIILKRGTPFFTRLDTNPYEQCLQTRYNICKHVSTQIFWTIIAFPTIGSSLFIEASNCPKIVFGLMIVEKDYLLYS